MIQNNYRLDHANFDIGFFGFYIRNGWKQGRDYDA